MKHISAFAILIILLSGCGNKKSLNANEALMQKHVPFFTVGASVLPRTKYATDCRKNIRDVICLVEPGEGIGMKRECLEGSQKYAAPFEALYDNYPPAFQKMFCSIKKLNIEKSFFGTAYARQIQNEDGSTYGVILGIRQSVIDENIDLTTWASWKEQLSFGANPQIYEYKKDLPKIETSSRTGVNAFLYFIIAHEFGHFFDFANDVNTFSMDKMKCPRWLNSEHCKSRKGSWSEFSWVAPEVVNESNKIKGRDGLCFYVAMRSICHSRILSPSIKTFSKVISSVPTEQQIPGMILLKP